MRQRGRLHAGDPAAAVAELAGKRSTLMSVSERPVVLVAEDDPSVRLTLEFVLQDEGFSVLVAGDGEQALAMAREVRPDVILLDHLMPKLAGRQVFEALRGSDSTSSIPVFVITGMAQWAGD